MGRGESNKQLLNKIRNEGKKTKKELSQQMKSSNFWSEVFRTLSLIGFYYAASIGLTFYQSWLLKKLQFPLTIVLVHFIMKFIAAASCRAGYTMYTGIDRVTLGWSHVLGRIGVVAVVASLDIALSQWSFEYIDVALYTVTKSTSIVFILFFSLLFRLEKKHWSLIVIVLMISSGLAMFTYKSTDFVFVGFFMVLSASFLSGIRWTLSQLIMQKSQLGLSNPVDMIYHVQPVMIMVLIPFAVGFEGVTISSSLALFRFEDSILFLTTITRVVAGGLIAFFMEVAEYLLVSYTSGLTLSVAGIVKEILSLGLAIVIESTDISAVNAVGLVVCMAGITLHVIRKASMVDKNAVTVTNGREYGRSTKKGLTSSMPLLSGSDSDSEMELYHTSPGHRHGSERKASVEEIFMQDHRQWTSVRDTHIENMSKSSSSATIYKNGAASYNSGAASYNSLQNENCVMTDDIVTIDDDVHDGKETDAIAEAERLLDQLDLLSSSES